MKIIEPHSPSGWITVEIDGHLVEAKVYDKPSDYGVENCRVSKLAIYKGSTRDLNSNWFNQLCYNYDRGLDFNKAPKGLLKKVLKELNSLPVLFPEKKEEHPGFGSEADPPDSRNELHFGPN